MKCRLFNFRINTSPQHDLDGNLISNGNAAYTWNANNRLVRVEKKSGLVATYQYDYMGRRTRKTVRQPDGSTSQSEFVYDGWNVIQETITSKHKEQSAKHSATRFYTWGRDLSGTLQGAGGVGGLLSIRIENAHSESEFLCPTYDANGNITEVVDGNGTVRGAFQYGPFGNLVSEMGDLAEQIPFRLSTKCFDLETGFNYYGFRYYSPTMGSWLSRDQIQENGGLNLFTFVFNQAVNLFDVLGNAPASTQDFNKITSGLLTGNNNGFDFETQTPEGSPSVGIGFQGWTSDDGVQNINCGMYALNEPNRCHIRDALKQLMKGEIFQVACDDIAKAVKQIKTIVEPIGNCCPAGYHRIHIRTGEGKSEDGSPSGARDFHVYRQNSDKTWTHFLATGQMKWEEGPHSFTTNDGDILYQTKIYGVDASNVKIPLDPTEADHNYRTVNYTDSCGIFCAKTHNRD